MLGAAEGERGGAARWPSARRRAARPRAIEATSRRWRERLSVITVRTPEPTFDALLNRWPLYQALSCRMWGRRRSTRAAAPTASATSSRTSMALVYAEPALAREHILRAAGRQFLEGDVQHWWHPQSGRGVRTRFSDDLAWLPYVVDHYVRVDRRCRRCSTSRCPSSGCARSSPDEHEVYDLPERRGEHGTRLRALPPRAPAGLHRRARTACR